LRKEKIVPRQYEPGYGSEKKFESVIGCQHWVPTTFSKMATLRGAPVELESCPEAAAPVDFDMDVYVNTPAILDNLTTALRRAEELGEAPFAFPSEEELEQMDRSVYRQCQQLAQVDELLQKAADMVFELHTNTFRENCLWIAHCPSGPADIASLTPAKDVTTRDFYKHMLVHIENAQHNFRGYSTNLKTLLAFQAAMRSTAMRAAEVSAEHWLEGCGEQHESG